MPFNKRFPLKLVFELWKLWVKFIFLVFIFEMLLFLIFLILISALKNLHPFILSQGLVGFSILAGGHLWFSSSLWIFIALIIIFLGGVIIIILYLSSLINNEKNKFSTTSVFIFFGIFMWIFNNPSNRESAIFYHRGYGIRNFLFREFYVFLFLYLIIYIFICLLGIVKISQSYKGGLKKIYFFSIKIIFNFQLKDLGEKK